MAARAMSFLAVLSGGADASKYICPPRHSLQMEWIHASAIAAEMIQLKPPWCRAVINLVEEAMSRDSPVAQYVWPDRDDKPTIAIDQRALPRPAPICVRFANMQPES